MKREVAGNTFLDGLLMDMNDFSKSNSTLASCLNGTLVTFNGNEYVLLNDLGNGRVETAYLPENYVPLGTASYGGIIYIVSYNPKDNKCLIGSFPSPERNISSDEISSEKYELSKDDFIHNDVVDTFVVEKKLGDTLYSPGDFFLVTGTNLANNVDQIFDPNGNNNSVNTTLKLSLGSTSEDGKVTILTNVKTYTISNEKGTITKKLILAPLNNTEEGQSPTVEEYRSVISQPYNVFSSKERGKLVLIAELLCCDSFTISVKNTFNDLGNYAPTITHYIEGNNYVYTGYNWVIKDSNNSVLSKGKVIRFGTFVTDGKSRTGSDTINTKISSTYNEIITIEVTPIMNWGEATFLKQTKTIDLSKIGTGAIELSQWKYYNDSSKCTIQWGLNTYLEEGDTIDSISMELKRITDYTTDSQGNTTYTFETLDYTISKKDDYNSTFYENIPLDTEYFKLTNGDKTGILVSDKLYLVTITINKKDKEGDSTPIHFYRWLLTNSMFNEYYKTVFDFSSLELNINGVLKADSTLRDIQGNTRYKLGNIKAIYDLDSATPAQTPNSTASVAVIDVTCEPSIIITPTIEGTDLFKFSVESSTSNPISFEIGNYNLSINGTKKELIGTEKLDLEYINYIETNHINTEGDFSPITDEELNNYTYDKDNLYQNSWLFYKGGELSPDTLEFELKENNLLKLKLDNLYTLNLQLISKAICNLRKDSVTSVGSFKPLAYNDTTYALYNLSWFDGKYTSTGSDFTDGAYLPMKIGTFAVHERTNVRGTASVGVFSPIILKDSMGNTTLSSTELSTFWSKREDNISLNFGELDMVVGLLQAGWNKGAMFVTNIGSPFESNLVPKNTANVNTDNSRCWLDVWYIFSLDPALKTELAKAVVIIALKSSDGNDAYWPINCAESNNPADGLPVEEGGENCHITDKTTEQLTKYFTFSRFKKLYRYFAHVLNTLYKYNTESITKKLEYPDTIVYNDKETATFELPLGVNSDNLRKTLLINISSNKYLPLTDYTSALNSTAVFKNALNINDVIPIKLTYNYNGSILLRDYILKALNITKGAAIFDYDGSTFLDFLEITPDMSALYSRVYISTGSMVTTPTKKVEPATHTFIVARPFNEQGIPAPINWEDDDVVAEYGKFINISNNFCLRDGLLAIKTVNPVGVIFNRDSSGDSGYVDGFLTMGFDDYYRPFKPLANESY